MSDRPTNEHRTAIQKLIAGSRETVTANLIQLMHRTAEDLVAGGVDRKAVAEAGLTTALGHYAAAVGGGALSVYLRDLADHFERLAMENSQTSSSRN